MEKVLKKGRNHGVYIPNYFLLLPTHGETDFSCGIATIAHLPLSMTHAVDCFKGYILTGLKNKQVFEKLGRTEATAKESLVKASNGNGYKALINIVQVNHPHYIENRLQMLPNFLQQDGKDLHSYHRAFIMKLRLLHMDVDLK